MTRDGPSVVVEARGEVLVVTVDRPGRRNAIDLATARLLADAFDRLDGDDRLRAGVLTGAGGTFSAGLDLRSAAAGEARPVLAGRGFAGLVERPPTKPLVAAIEGSAVGGGFELALACDLLVAADDATFALPEVRVGLVPGGGGLFRLPSRVPYHLAMELVLTGAPLTAQRAHELGLLNRLVPAGEALDAAVELARTVAASAPLAVAAATGLVRAAAGRTDAEAFAAQVPVIAALRATADAQEGPRAFVEKRPPVWLGR